MGCLRALLASLAVPSWEGTMWQLHYKKGPDSSKMTIGQNPKSESRNPKQIRNSNDQKRPAFEFRISNLFRISTFGFRIYGRSAYGLHLLLECGWRFPQHGDEQQAGDEPDGNQAVGACQGGYQDRGDEKQ